MVRIGFTSLALPLPLPLRTLRELVEQVLEASRLLVQLVQRPAARFREREDLGTQVSGAVRGEAQRDATVARVARGRHLEHPRQLSQRLRDAVPRRLDGDLDRALSLAHQA